MAENKSQAQHLASLDLDISDLLKTLKEVDEQIKQSGIEAGKTWSASVKQGMQNAFSESSNGIKEFGNSVSEQKKVVKDYGNQVENLSESYEKSGKSGESFLRKISDKAKWLGAFYVVNEIKNGLFATIDIIKSTEDAVVDLQRVLNDDSISQSRMSDALYDIAYEYGRTFDEVAEVSTQFAQAGYDWMETMELTRGTMLALNTAELDVTQSTQGLIAILAQWNLEAEDYATVIDKINITADNFAVTSENIVAALQRSSSSARNANISLEQTIGIITALAEATGRSGENIGTALNSLIIYTSKSSALETFAKNGSDAMKQVVSDYQKGAVSIYDVWKQLSKELSGLTASQQATLFQSEEYQAFADELESQAEEYTSQIKEVYGAAGTYRQNYFIALLNDIAKAEDAVKGMAEAEGYSAQENEKYMESLTANWNQLLSSLAELAVQLGEAGLMDLAKVLIDIAKGATQLTKSLGGVVPLLTAIAGIIIKIKSEKISGFFSKIFGYNDESKIAKITLKFREFNDVVSEAPGIMGKFKTAANFIGNSFTSLAGAIGAVITSIGLVSMVVSSVSNAFEEARRQSVESAQANLEEAESINNLKDEYISIVNFTGDASEKTEQLTEFKKKLIVQYGLEREAVEKLNGARKDEIDFLDKEYAASVKRAWVDIESNYQKSIQAIENANKNIDFSFPVDPESIEALREYFEITESIDKFGSKSYDISFGTSNIYDQRDALAALLSSGKLNEQVAIDLRKRYEEINAEIEKWGEVYSTGVETASEMFFLQEDTLDLIEKINSASSESSQKEIYDELIESVKETNYGLEAQESIISTIEQMFPQFAESAKEAQESIASAGETVANSFENTEEYLKSLEDSISSLSSQVSEFQSAYNSVNSAIEEYNQNGYVSIDTLQNLISMGAQYWDMLNFTANGLTLNKTAAENLMIAQKNNIDLMIQQEAAAEILRIAQSYLGNEIDSTNASMQSSSGPTATLEAGIFNITQKAITGTASISQFKNEINSLFNIQSQNASMKQMYNEMQNVITNARKLSSALSGISTSARAWGNSVSSAASSSNSALESQRKELEAQKEAIKDRYDAEIEALRDLQEERDRAWEQEEYYRRRREILKDIESASVRSGIEYREQEDDLRQQLSDLDAEWNKKLEDWDIEDRIAELEKLRDAEIAAIDAQLEALQEASSQVYGSMPGMMADISSDMLDAYVNEFVEPAKKSTKDILEEGKNMIEQIRKQLDNYDVFGGFVNSADKSSKSLYETYKRNFFFPVQQEAAYTSNLISQSITGALVGVRTAIPTYTNTTYRIPSNSSVVNNNTRNSNIFANVYNQNSANSVVRSIFNYPN